MEFKRVLDLSALLQQNSFFLFGPRATGKSFLIRKSLPEARVFNLLNDDTYEQLLRRPASLGEQIQPSDGCVVIDEVQKLPKLLDEIHRIIEDRASRGTALRFLLTGSSARKLKRGGANLLAGRAWESHLFPLTYKELGDQFDLLKYINFGGLPRIWNSPNPHEELKAYTRVYLAEEIKAEALVRSYERFVRFLETMALCNGKEINYQQLSSDAGVPARTLEGYIEVLKDTLIGYELIPFRETKKRKANARSKFYFFDTGVARFLRRSAPIQFGNVDFGDGFEHFIINEIRAYNSYSRQDETLSYWRTRSEEVDLVVGHRFAVEIKSSDKIKDSYFTGLEKLKEEGLVSRFYLISRCTEEGVRNGIEYLYYETFLKRLCAESL